MGTNYYLVSDGRHVGKRSAAGMYCWDCKEILHADNETSDGKYQCPMCSEIESDEGWNSSVGRELGFNNEKPHRKSGVASCSSFAWDIDPLLITYLFDTKRKKIIVDEYGRKFTAAQFNAILEECPIVEYDSIGDDFS